MNVWTVVMSHPSITKIVSGINCFFWTAFGIELNYFVQKWIIKWLTSSRMHLSPVWIKKSKIKSRPCHCEDRLPPVSTIFDHRSMIVWHFLELWRQQSQRRWPDYKAIVNWEIIKNSSNEEKNVFGSIIPSLLMLLFRINRLQHLSKASSQHFLFSL